MSSAGAQAAALPWGTTEDAPRAGAAAAVEPDLPSQLGLGLGSRIEVLWLVHTEEEGAQEEATLAKASAPCAAPCLPRPLACLLASLPPCNSAPHLSPPGGAWSGNTASSRPPARLQWWGAVLEAQAGGETDGEGRQVYRLRQAAGAHTQADGRSRPRSGHPSPVASASVPSARRRCACWLQVRPRRGQRLRGERDAARHIPLRS